MSTEMDIPLIQTDKQITDVLERIIAEPYETDIPPIDAIIRELEEVKDAVHSDVTKCLWYSRKFLRIGRYIKELMPGGEIPTNTFVTMLMAKGRLYGPKPIRSWGSLGVCIRIDSKILRLQHLRNNPVNSNANSLSKLHHEEAEEDTVLDILGYCVLGYLFEREKR